jgi:uncharacterized coiled-coil protein SlyX
MPPVNPDVAVDLHELEDKLHEHDTRLVKVETKQGFMEQTLEQNAQRLTSIDQCVKGTQLHIAKQNGVLPGLQETMKTVLKKLDTSQTQQTVVATRQKIVWGVLGAAAVTILGILAKILLGV